MRSSDIRFGTRFGWAMGSYAALLVLAITLTRTMPDSDWRYLVMALPVPALVLLVWTIGRHLRETDEMQARILLESLGFGFAGGSLITFTWGLMQTVGAPDVNW